MKSLYESILSSTKTGMQSILDECDAWLKENDCMLINQLNAYGAHYKLDFDDDFRIGIYLDKKVTKSSISGFTINDKMLDNNKLKYNFLGVFSKDGEVLPVVLMRCHAKDISFIDDMGVKEVCLFGGDYDKIDSLPKDCEEIEFQYAPDLSGGQTVEVGEIKNIKAKYLRNIAWHGYRSGLTCKCDNIKGCKFDDIEVTSPMLEGYYTLYGRSLSKSSQDILDRLVKNNNIKRVHFLPCYDESERIKKYMCVRKKDGWHLSIEERR